MAKKSRSLKQSNEINQEEFVGETTAVKDTSPRVYQRNKINFDFSIRELPWTEKQKILLDILSNKKTRCVFIEGPAGCSKTSTAVYAGLQLLKQKRASDIIFVRSAVESADSKIGYLPGTIDEKFESYMAPFTEKMEEFLDAGTIKRLHADKRVSAMPVNYIRGLHWPAKVIIVDECQNLTFKELVTTITRLGEFSKIVFLGDPYQSDLPGTKSGGFSKMCKMFDGEDCEAQGIYHFKFDKDDIVRSEFVKFVVNKLETYAQTNHEMFPST
jgi:phosphate starvation-inducible PhoH-like protein